LVRAFSVVNIDFLLPCVDFGYKAFLVIDAPIQALTAQHADIDLDYVQQIPKFPSRSRFHCLTTADEQVTQ
jgi:hypothetical protein